MREGKVRVNRGDPCKFPKVKKRETFARRGREAFREGTEKKKTRKKPNQKAGTSWELDEREKVMRKTNPYFLGEALAAGKIRVARRNERSNRRREKEKTQSCVRHSSKRN